MNERKYFVVMENKEPIVVTVKDDVNRPNNPSCEDVLDDYIVDNYGFIGYGFYEIDTCDQVIL
ncbi:hypothetical protein [Bacillus sp. 1P06AnD]|uniref:hypothetical protein n=1 Tax=Bacillus sp. 1P06AnD TaxID=3132208 RepID=UPI0039A0AABD